MTHPDTELRHINAEIGSGVFATRLIPRGTIVWTLCDFDRIYSPGEVAAMGPPYRDLVYKFSYVNTAGNFVLAWDLGRYINHSCEPAMLSVRSDIDIAVRDIHPGEELTCDYGSWATNDFHCACGAPTCRGVIRGDDVFRFYRGWDEQVSRALPWARKNPQLLSPFLRNPQEFWDYADGKKKFPSILTHAASVTDGDGALPRYDKRSMNYVSPKLESSLVLGVNQNGVRARTAVEKGELLVVFGGRVGTRAELDAFTKERQRHALQLDENQFFLPPEVLDAGDFVNHSCDPNAVLFGPVALLARRRIQAGEPICYDYATSDGCDYDEFDCHCGASDCRGRVTASDWSRPDLQERYAGHFSPYLQRRIEAMKKSVST